MYFQKVKISISCERAHLLRIYLHSLVIASVFLSLSSLSYAQNITTVPQAPVVAKDVFRVGVTLFGINNETGNVFSFVIVNNLSAGRFFNATNEDMTSDNDGVVESVLSFHNRTIPNGTMYTACNIILEKPMLNCSKGFNSPSIRTEFSQFLVK